MSYEITGFLREKFDTHHVSSTFRKRAFVVEIVETSSAGVAYPEVIQLEFIQDKVDLLDKYNIGDTVEVCFNLKGREWFNPKTQQKNFFNTLQAWKIKEVGAGSGSEQPPPPVPASASAPLPEPEQKESPTPLPMSSFENEDDIPF
jgi:hypothetical protein